ncbi:PleD family two-component system response regulator [Pseudochryseolinea flava]|uniref:Response regulatory domain-containing protein n=1 Tax=Pseudochryseolinea flava TaxID=2059302 RepID=A0A364Y4S5_9BACT|nr:response regulator transcription factor [Pseudochryseolinea flava]RAW01998.1 hypothetical protein DQQ10_05425 [Pseudochryseolinea flava]
MNILLIKSRSDEPDVFSAALQHLRIDATYRREFCCDDAFSRYSKKAIPKPDYIFLDIDMLLLMDGYSCLKMIRCSLEFVGTPVIVCAPSGQADDIEFMLRHGASLSLIKHSDFLMFCSCLDEIIRPEARLMRSMGATQVTS